MKRIVVALTAATLLAGCGLLGGRDTPTTPTVGQRIPVLTSDNDVEIDPQLAGTPVIVPAPLVNPDWTQSGGNAAKSVGHVALGSALTQLWSVSIGQGSSTQARLAAEPVVAEGRVYTIDTRAMVRAFNADTGAQIWATQVRGENSPSETLFGGGVVYDSGRI